MAEKWIPVRDELPEVDDWVQVQTQDGTVFPASYQNNKWVPLFRGGLVEQLMHGKVAYWCKHETPYPYVQCKCGNFYLQAEGRKICPICASMGIVEQKTEKKPRKTEKAVKQATEAVELPFAEEEDNIPVDEEVIF